MRKPKTLWLLTLLALAAQAAAQEKVDDEKQEAKEASAEKTPSEQVKDVIAEHRAANDAFMEAYQAATTDEERNAAFEELYPDVGKFTPRLWKIAAANVGSAAELDALAWIGENSNDPSDSKPVLEAAIASHVNSPRLAGIVERAYIRDTRMLDLVDAIFASSPHVDVQGIACFQIAQYWKGRADGGAGEEALARAEELFEVLLAEYPEVRHWRGTLKDAAASELFELRNLGIGKPAPEITGADVDGVEFKLSDYRGKVVVLDFWGDW